MLTPASKRLGRIPVAGDDTGVRGLPRTVPEQGGGEAIEAADG